MKYENKVTELVNSLTDEDLLDFSKWLDVAMKIDEPTQEKEISQGYINTLFTDAFWKEISKKEVSLGVQVEEPIVEVKDKKEKSSYKFITFMKEVNLQKDLTIAQDNLNRLESGYLVPMSNSERDFQLSVKIAEAKLLKEQAKERASAIRYAEIARLEQLYKVEKKSNDVKKIDSWGNITLWSNKYDVIVSKDDLNKCDNINDWASGLVTETANKKTTMSIQDFDAIVDYALVDKKSDSKTQEVTFEALLDQAIKEKNLLEKGEFELVSVIMKHKVLVSNINYSSPRLAKNYLRLSMNSLMEEMKNNTDINCEGVKDYFSIESTQRGFDSFGDKHRFDSPKQFFQANFGDDDKRNLAISVALKNMNESHEFDKTRVRTRPDAVVLLEKKHNLEKEVLRERIALIQGYEFDDKNLLNSFKEYKTQLIDYDYKKMFKEGSKLRMKEMEVETKPFHSTIDKAKGQQYDYFKDGTVYQTNLLDDKKESKLISGSVYVAEREKSILLNNEFEVKQDKLDKIDGLVRVVRDDRNKVVGERSISRIGGNRGK